MLHNQTLAFCLLFALGCSGGDPGVTDVYTEDGDARICAEAMKLDGTFVLATMTHNDVPFAGDCMNVDPSVEHVIKTDARVSDLNCPNHTVTIAANDLKSGEERHVRFLYKKADKKLLTVNTVENVGVISMPIDGVIHFDGQEVGVGEVTIEYDPSVPHRVTFEDIYLLVAPNDIVMNPDVYPGHFMITVTYEAAENVAEVCFYPRNAETSENIDAIVTINGTELDEGVNCRFVSVMNVVRGSSEYRNWLNTPQPIKIPPNTLQSGSSYEFNLVYDTDTMRLCVDTAPVLGEVFLVDSYGLRRSIGWPLDDEYACANVNTDREAWVEFGEVEGFETAESVTEFVSDEWQLKTIHGLYNPSELALVCVIHQIESGGGGWIYIDGVTLNDQSFKPQNYREWACLAADPAIEYTITWGLDESDYFAPPEPIVVPANTLVVGERNDFVGVYTNSGSTSSHREIRVNIRNAFGYPQRAQFYTNSYLYDSHEYRSFWYSNDLSEVEFEFQDVPHLVTPAPLLIDLAALDVNDPNYNPVDSIWEFEVVYSNAEPSAWVCLEAINHEGELINVNVDFDGLGPASYADPLQKCRVLPVGNDHIIVPGGSSGFRWPGNLYIPNGKLATDSSKTYTVEYVLENRYAELCLGTSGVAGEIVLNGRSLGWPALLNSCQVRTVVDMTRVNTITVSDEPAYAEPSPLVFNPGDLEYGTFQEFILQYVPIP